MWKEHEAFIRNTARSYARSYVKLEEEDIIQEVWVFLWEKEHYFLENGCSDQYIRTSIKNVINNYALRMRDTTLLETDTFYYSIEEVKALLPSFFSLYESWATAEVPEGAKTMTKNDNVEMMCDLSLAFSKLSKAQQDILVRKYGDDEDFAEHKDVQQASRAVKKLWLTVNANTDQRAKEFEGPGSREVITNAKGVYLSGI